MATRWKSAIKKSAVYLRNHKSVAIGLIAAMTAALCFFFLFDYFAEFSTREIWMRGIICDIPAAVAILTLLPPLLRWAYRGWLPENADFYQEWKQKNRRQQRILFAVFGILFLLVIVFFKYQSGYMYFYYYYNFAMSYYLGATVILYFGLCQLCVRRFMADRLSLMMEKVNEINRERLAEAVEIERRSMEKAAKSEQLKVDLISNVSHDLKTPLTSMVGYLELLKKEDLDDISRDYVEVISTKAEKLKEMIESLFSLAKASSGNIRIHPEPVELNMLLEQIFADLSDRINDSGLQFVKGLTEEDTHLMTDNLHMYRICQNLIENALKYSAPRTRVFVKTYFAMDGAQRRLYLEITNTAGYFMDFAKEDIVERFARGDKARSSDGNGLGLAIVSTYAGALGGAFDIGIDCDQFKAILSFPAEDEQKEAAAGKISEEAEA